MRVHLQPVGTFMLLLVLTGCGLHHKPKPAPVAQAQPPDLSQSPLYSPELGQNDPNPPSLPGAAVAKAQPSPPAQPEPKKRSVRHPKSTIVKPATEDGAVAQKETAPPPAAVTQHAGTTATGDAAAQTPAPVQQAVVKAAVEPEASGSAIGQLTAGTTPDAVETKRETVDLIQSAEKGVQDLKRSLSSEEKKAVAQIKSFLQQAQRALDNGDTDGAHTLATKAKVMLDELSTGG